MSDNPTGYIATSAECFNAALVDAFQRMTAGQCELWALISAELERRVLEYNDAIDIASRLGTFDAAAKVLVLAARRDEAKCVAAAIVSAAAGACRSAEVEAVKSRLQVDARTQAKERKDGGKADGDSGKQVAGSGRKKSVGELKRDYLHRCAKGGDGSMPTLRGRTS